MASIYDPNRTPSFGLEPTIPAAPPYSSNVNNPFLAPTAPDPNVGGIGQPITSFQAPLPIGTQGAALGATTGATAGSTPVTPIVPNAADGNKILGMDPNQFANLAFTLSSAINPTTGNIRANQALSNVARQRSGSQALAGFGRNTQRLKELQLTAAGEPGPTSVTRTQNADGTFTETIKGDTDKDGKISTAERTQMLRESLAGFEAPGSFGSLSPEQISRIQGQYTAQQQAGANVIRSFEEGERARVSREAATALAGRKETRAEAQLKIDQAAEDRAALGEAFVPTDIGGKKVDVQRKDLAKTQLTLNQQKISAQLGSDKLAATLKDKDKTDPATANAISKIDKLLYDNTYLDGEPISISSTAIKNLNEQLKAINADYRFDKVNFKKVRFVRPYLGDDIEIPAMAIPITIDNKTGKPSMSELYDTIQSRYPDAEITLEEFKKWFIDSGLSSAGGNPKSKTKTTTSDLNNGISNALARGGR